MNVFRKICRKLNQKRVFHAAAKNRKTSNCINWGILGTGYMANQFSNALRCVPEANIAAVASRNMDRAKQFCKKHKVLKAYGSYEEMLRDSSLKIDIVYIATPYFEHYRHIKMALQHGKNVICEKPFVVMKNQAEELYLMAKQQKCFLMEGMWSYCLPTYLTAEKWVRDGMIGDIKQITVDLSKIEENSPEYLMNQGILYDFGIYPVSFFSRYSYKDYQILSCKKQVSEKGIDLDWDLHIISNGIRGRITFSAVRQGTQEAVITGTRGRIEFKKPFHRTNTVRLINQSGQVVETKSCKYIDQGFEYEIQEVHRCIREQSLWSKCVPYELTHRNIEILERLCYMPEIRSV